MTRWTNVVVSWLLLVVLFNNGVDSSNLRQGDLPPNAPVRLLVKFRPPVCDQKSKLGDKLWIHYTGTLRKDGSKFDSSLDRNSPMEMILGARQVIKGWDQGLVDMCVGEKRMLVVPSGVGYGDNGLPPKIPGKATLVFEIELLKIKRLIIADPFSGH